ncbi:MAG: GTP-binding protein [Bryobacteraceae bacterium]
MLRVSTAGSVDDGKSTLIGRLLHDTHSVYEDQLEAVRKSPVNRSGGAVDLSLLTDGLRAEREQGITIDVAYRYFSTPRRTFILADTPGHEQYTPNMATGASTADVAVILVDARKGLLAQSRRHAFTAALLGVPELAGIPPTFRGVARSFAVVTGHACGGEEPDWTALVRVDTLIILMGVARRAQIARHLIDAGRDRHQPVAFIENGTLALERVVTANLESVASGRIEVSSPAVLVVGEVVRVRQELEALAAGVAVPAGA